MPSVPNSKEAIDTPALLLDVTAMEQNIADMARFADEAGVNLRPHCKTHKSPHIAARQLAAGAIGITCQKLGEAEVMVDAGIEGLLIANQIVGQLKIDRLVALRRRSDLMVAVDALQNATDLSTAMQAAGLRLKVLIEVDVGMGRCGVQPGEPSLALAQALGRLPGLELAGLMGYEGHAVLLDDAEERRQKALAALQLLVDTADLLRSHGIPVPIVSSSGTGTYDVGGRFPGITEIQVGSYATMDGRYRQVGVPFQPALTVLTTVISTPQEGVAITDAGVKSLTVEFGWPQVVGMPNAEVAYLSEEHAKLVLSGGVQLKPGDRLELLPTHGCTTFNLHDTFYVMRGGIVEDVWPVAARGRSQ